jgi:hypothetical protein
MHLRLALDTLKDPIPETLFLEPDPEDRALTEDFDTDVFDRFDEWDDALTVVAFEAQWLQAEVGKWKREVEVDLVSWGGETCVA